MNNTIQLLVFVAAFIFTANAQTFTIGEGKPLGIKYDYDGLLPARVYVDAVPVKTFTVSDLTVSTNSVTGGLFYSIRITLTNGLPRGNRAVTISLIDGDGTEGEQTSPAFAKVKPKAPWNFGLF